MACGVVVVAEVYFVFGGFELYELVGLYKTW